MAVAFDVAGPVTEDFSVTTVTTASFTIAATANRVAYVGLSFTADPGTISNVTVGGVTGSAISGATYDNQGGVWSRAYKVIAPASGSQTASATWTNSASVSLSVIVANGVDQTSGLNNGTTSTAAANNVSVNVTSNAGDLTVTTGTNDQIVNTATSNQTKRITSWGYTDTGPGTAGPITHTWTQTGSFSNSVIGANFISATVNPIITGQPSNQLVYEDQTATFTITATGTGTLHYQWKDDGSNVGTDSSTYAPTATLAMNGSLITCDVTDDNGTTSSDAAYLNVIPTSHVGWLKA